MNKKGFTLIELIVVVIILGVIIAFALPNITSNMERNKKDAYLNDAKDMIEKTQAIVSVNPAFLPSESEISIFNLNFIDKNNDIKKSEFGLEYNRSLSFVTVKKVNNEYEYKVSLLACTTIKNSFEPTESTFSPNNISFVAPRGPNEPDSSINYVYYDINKDGYVNNSDINSYDNINITTIANIDYYSCEEDYNYRLIRWATLQDLNGVEKFNKVEEPYNLNNITNDKPDSYIDEIINDGSKTKLKFYY